jgi:hypothetical protein
VGVDFEELSEDAVGEAPDDLAGDFVTGEGAGAAGEGDVDGALIRRVAQVVEGTQ